MAFFKIGYPTYSDDMLDGVFEEYELDQGLFFHDVANGRYGPLVVRLEFVSPVIWVRPDLHETAEEDLICIRNFVA